jgi:hypothetical protein
MIDSDLIILKRSSCKMGFTLTCVGLRLALHQRRAIRSARPLESQDVLQAEYTED